MSSSALSARRIPVTTSGTTLIHVDFLVTGIVMTFLGPMLPILSTRWSLPDVRAGYLLFTQFFSSMFGMLLSGALVQRIGYRLTLIIGLVLMAAGMVLLAFGPFLLGIISVCILGVGYGVTTPAGNLRTAEINPKRSAAALNVINAVWGIGAMSSPFLIVLAQRVHRTSLFLFGTAAALLVLLLAFAIARFEPDTHATPNLSGAGNKLWQSRMLPVICVLFFIYVGTETSFGAWVAMYARRTESGPNSLWTITPSFFWGALLVGRSLAPFVLNYFSETTVARAGLASSLAGCLALINAHGMPPIIAGTVLAGMGLASIFPISVSLLPGWFGDSARSASGAVFSAGNMGGAILPWVVGAVSTRYGSLRTAFLVPLAGVVLMLAFYLARRSPTLETAKATPKNC